MKISDNSNHISSPERVQMIHVWLYCIFFLIYNISLMFFLYFLTDFQFCSTLHWPIVCFWWRKESRNIINNFQLESNLFHVKTIFDPTNTNICSTGTDVITQHDAGKRHQTGSLPSYTLKANSVWSGGWCFHGRAVVYPATSGVC